MMGTGAEPRDHLFINYAREDSALAEWLTLKLTSEGYQVWCDRVKLLGGESYPKDITLAIQTRTFRMIALLSRSSINKPNPLKERTLAQALSRERQEDFVIPVNVDGIRAHEMDFQSSDLVYIPFDRSWADGLAQLIKKLNELSAPKGTSSGPQAVSTWLLQPRFTRAKEEELWSNLVPVLEVPKTIHRYEFDRPESFATIGKVWPYFRQNSKTVWSFFPPPDDTDLESKEKEVLEWSRPREGLPFEPADAVSQLLRRSVLVYCRGRGMVLDESRDEVRFSLDKPPDGWLRYVDYSGAVRRVRAVGERSFRAPLGMRVQSRYHLAASFSPFLGRFGVPVLAVNLGVYWTDLEGNPLPPGLAQRRRRALCNTWWNGEWLARVTALLAWTGDGREEIEICQTESGPLRLAGRPLRLTSDTGIDESALVLEPPLDEDAELDESVPDDSEEPESDAGQGE